MKSIVEEASSVVKAIEKGWIQAGKPQEFSVKVFEVEQKNFLGLTTKSAKIALFYNGKTTDKAHPRSESTDKRHQQPKREARPQKKEYPKEQPHSAEHSTNQPRAIREEKREQPARERETWSDEMVAFSQTWLKNTLSLMNMPNHPFSVEVKNYYLKINFDKPLLQDPEKEKLLFRSFAHLAMQSLRNKFKKGFRGFKVILNSGK